MKEYWDRLASGATIIAALAVAVVAIHREFGDRTPTKPRPVLVKEWEQLGSAGVWVGDSTALIRIVEVADFECPYCKRVHDSLTAISHRAGADIGVLFIHYPLRSHRFAKPAANASMCAQKVGKFASFQDALFAQQDSLGLKTWSAYAVTAGIEDTLGFNRCIADPSIDPLVSRGLLVGDSLNVTSTPTVIINGLRYASPPLDSLGAMVDDALRGKRGRR